MNRNILNGVGTFMNDKHAIIIVSGLPRSGTSMMMKILAAGGIEILTDRLREADENNPEGYYEFEPVKKLRDGDFSWVEDAVGKAVKVIATLVNQLPVDYNYKIIFMKRNMSEILASQKKMLGRMGKSGDEVSDETMKKIFESHVNTVGKWLSKQSNIETLYVHYNEMIVEPTDPINQINDFLGGHLDTSSMASVINKDLYRERK